MSVRRQPTVPPYREDAPLPRVYDEAGRHVGTAIPVFGQSVYTAPEQANLHAFRRGLVCGRQQVSPPSPPSAAVGATAGGLAKPTTIKSQELAFERALCEAAASGSWHVLGPLIDTGYHTRVIENSPLAATAMTRRADVARYLVKEAGYSVTEAAVSLNAKGEVEAAAWLMRV